MSGQAMTLFDLAERRLHWLDHRQTVLAQNISNANTPGYVAQDIKPFGQALTDAVAGLDRTDPAHLTGRASLLGTQDRTRPTERAPDGNAVSLEDQLVKIANTDDSQALVMNMYRKYLGFYRTALGK